MPYFYPMVIRPYTPADKQACIDAFNSNVPKFFALAEVPDFEQWLDEQESRIAAERNSNEQYYVAELDNNIVGCGGYFIDPEKQKAIMTWGLVHHSLHKQGLGKELFLYRLAVIKSVCPDCTVTLDTSQHSYPFFQKLGFVVTKITNNFYAPGIDRYDMVLEKERISPDNITS